MDVCLPNVITMKGGKMEYLEKDKTLIERNTAGELLPIDVTLELAEGKPVVQMTPLTKGDLQELLSLPDKEDEIVRTHLFKPAYTEDEFKFIKPTLYGAIKMALLSMSTDSSQKDIQDSSVKALIAESKKKSTSQSAS